MTKSDTPLSDDNICLRAVEPEDAMFMYDCENDSLQWVQNSMMAPISQQMLTDYALTYDADIYRARQLRLICFDKSTGKRLGIADIFDVNFKDSNAFVGVYTIPDYRRKGIASIMLKLLKNYSFNILSLNTLAAKISSDNSASMKLFSKAGYILKGTLHNWIKTQDGFIDLLIFQLEK